MNNLMIGHRAQITQGYAPGAEAVMNSLDLLDLVNEARKQHNEKEVRRADFNARCRDELEGEYYETFVVSNPRGPASEALRLTKDQCMLIAMRESKAVRRYILRKLKVFEERAANLPRPEKLVGELALMECFTRLLRPAPSSQISMLTHIAKQNGLDSSFLPGYAVDAAPDATGGSSMPTVSLTGLLKQHDIKLSASVYNTLLRDIGILELRMRKTSKGEDKTFWAITEKGLRFGKNLTSPAAPRETQPHWYAERFADLHTLVMQRMEGGQ
uniref:hypothetical protein n=1 Tax=Castellaniella defragrans TaxID=75697 RepID=UPI00333F81E8